jgi:CMP-N-acetylneuraminic acid synthetase
VVSCNSNFVLKEANRWIHPRIQRRRASHCCRRTPSRVTVNQDHRSKIIHNRTSQLSNSFTYITLHSTSPVKSWTGLLGTSTETASHSLDGFVISCLAFHTVQYSQSTVNNVTHTAACHTSCCSVEVYNSKYNDGSLQPTVVVSHHLLPYGSCFGSINIVTI